MQDRIFYAICFGFVFGVFLRSFPAFGGTPPEVVLLLAVMGVALFLFFTLISKRKWGIVFSVFILTFSFGIFRFQIADKPAPDILESKVEERVSFSGIIVDEPDKRENNQKLTVEVNEENE